MVSGLSDLSLCSGLRLLVENQFTHSQTHRRFLVLGLGAVGPKGAVDASYRRSRERPIERDLHIRPVEEKEGHFDLIVGSVCEERRRGCVSCLEALATQHMERPPISEKQAGRVLVDRIC